MVPDVYRNQVGYRIYGTWLAFRKDIQAVITTDAIKQNASHEQLILTLLTNELQQRMINREKARLRSASFPQLKYARPGQNRASRRWQSQTVRSGNAGVY